MRKLGVSIALVASLALGAVAMADNSQDILSASGTPRGKGTPAKPVPKTLKMTFEITNADDPAQRPIQTQRFSLAAEGVVDFGKRFPMCTFSQATQRSLAAVKRACGQGARRWGAWPGTSPVPRMTPRSQRASAAI